MIEVIYSGLAISYSLIVVSISFYSEGTDWIIYPSTGLYFSGHSSMQEWLNDINGCVQLSQFTFS